jgi:anti-sigma factor RsiW
MHDPWTDRLSEYIDGELDAGQARLLEEHLASCPACRALHGELLHVVDRARALTDREPPRELWEGIAAGIAPPAVVPFPPAPPPRPRTFSFTMPQLAAAALLLVTVSAGAAWMATAGRTGESAGEGAGDVVAEGTIFQSVMTPRPAARPVDGRPAGSPAATPAVSTAAAALAALLEEARDQLDPATVEVLERSMESIEGAIAMAEAALAADPGNPRLQRQLDSTLQRRAELADRVSRVQRGGA